MQKKNSIIVIIKLRRLYNIKLYNIKAVFRKWKETYKTQ